MATPSRGELTAGTSDGYLWVPAQVTGNERGGVAVYSLLTAATLGLDLVRRTTGLLVASLLQRALTADAGFLEDRAAVEVPAPTPDRRQRRLTRSPGRRKVADRDRGRVDGSHLVDELDRITFGNGGALARLVREDILGPEHTAARQTPRPRSNARPISWRAPFRRPGSPATCRLPRLAARS